MGFSHGSKFRRNSEAWGEAFHSSSLTGYTILGQPLPLGGDIFSWQLHSFGSLAWQLGTRRLCIFTLPPFIPLALDFLVLLLFFVPILASMLAGVLLLFFVSLFLALNHVFIVIINLITDCIIYVFCN